MKLIKLLIVFLFLATPCWATTYYVRSDGADIGDTSTTCNGLYDVAYTEGNGPNCAVNTPLWLLRFNGTTSPASVFVGGDTMIIDGTGDATYTISASATGAGSGTECVPSYSFDCQWKIPAGTAEAHTKILGKGYDTETGTKPTLKGEGSIYKGVINIIDGQNYIDIEYLNITDGEECISILDQNNTSYPCTEGKHARYGIWGEVNDTIKLKNIDIVGMATGCVMFSAASNWEIDNVLCRGGGMVGYDSDSPYRTGTTDGQSGVMTMIDSEVEYIGCVIGLDGNVISNSCVGQGTDINVGFGDAFGFADGSMASWTIENLICQYNTSDCFDGLHGDGSGFIKIRNSKFLSNSGAAIKGSAAATIENNLIVDDCAWALYKDLMDPLFLAGGTHAGKQFLCRADSTLSIQIPAGVEHRFIGNTIFGNHDQIFSVAGCGEGSMLYARNNIIYGGREHNDDTSVLDPWATSATGNENTDAYYFYNGCAQGVHFDEDYNIFYLTKGGSGDVLGANSYYGDPGFSDTIPRGPYNTVGYFSTIGNEFNKFFLNESAYARYEITGATTADETVTFWGDGNVDLNYCNRGNNWDTGALEYNGLCDRKASNITLKNLQLK